MSNLYAISATTATLSYLLRSEGKTIITKPPDTLTTGSSRLNIFLYHVSKNSGYNNMDHPARDFGGEMITKQQVGLDLYYLLTAYGNNDEELLAQKILADAVMILHEKPVLTKDLIEAAINDPDIKSQMSDINNADLSKQVDLVKLNMHPLSLEELTKIWSSFFKTGSYRISVAYKATVVLLDGIQETKNTMPVRERNVYTVTPKKPEITYVQPQMVEHSTNTEIIIHGKSLNAKEVKIDFNEGLELEDMPSPTSISDQKLEVELSESILCGIKQVKVIHPLLMGTPEKLHKGSESNYAFFALVPKILDVEPPSSPVGAKIKITFEPKIKKEQDVRIIIGTGKPLAVEWPDNNDMETDNVEVRIPADLKNGTYPIRLRVDGAESQPDDDISNEFKRLTVEIT